MVVRLLIFILLANTFCLSQSRHFQSSGYSYGAASYLELALHAHAASLARAVTAWTDELAGVQYNPAILDQMEGTFCIVSYSFLSDDRKHQGADIAFPVGDFLVAGASANNAGVDDIEQRDEYGIVDSMHQSFGFRELAIALSIAGRLPHNISLGLRGRYLSENFPDIENGSAHGMGFDLGAIWQPDKRLCVGISGLNLLSWVWWATGQRNPVLPQARGGIAGKLFNQTLTIELDVVKTLRQPLDISGGVEYTFFQIVSARAGALTSVSVQNRSSRMPDFTGGLGVRYKLFGCDYGITIPMENATALITHTVSLLLSFRKGWIL